MKRRAAYFMLGTRSRQEYRNATLDPSGSACTWLAPHDSRGTLRKFRIAAAINHALDCRRTKRPLQLFKFDEAAKEFRNVRIR